MRWRAVVFDLGGVILGSPIQAFVQYETELGLEPHTLNRMIVARGPEAAWARLERGEIGMEAFFAAFEAEAEAEGARISARELMARVERISQPRPQMLRAVQRLRDAGVGTAALTNNWASTEQSQKMNALRDRFDVFVESAVVGLRKPDPRIYRLTCERLDVSPEEAVFLDDIGRNLKAARGLGMATIKVDDPDAALRELSALVGIELA